MVYPDNEIYYSVLKRNELSNHEKTWKKPNCLLPNQRSQSEKATIVYDSNNMKCWEMQNYGDTKMISGYQGLREREG